MTAVGFGFLEMLGSGCSVPSVRGRNFRWRLSPTFVRRTNHSPLPPHTNRWQSLRPSHLARGLDSRREIQERLPYLYGVVVGPKSERPDRVRQAAFDAEPN